MIEKLIVLEDIDPVIFYGVNNANMQLIKAFETRVNGQHFDPNIIFNMKEQTLNRQRIGCSKKGNGIVVQQLPTIYPKPLQKKYPMELFKYPNVSLHLQNVSLKERIEL